MGQELSVFWVPEPVGKATALIWCLLLCPPSGPLQEHRQAASLLWGVGLTPSPHCQWRYWSLSTYPFLTRVPPKGLSAPAYESPPTLGLVSGLGAGFPDSLLQVDLLKLTAQGPSDQDPRPPVPSGTRGGQDLAELLAPPLWLLGAWVMPKG